MTASPTTAAAEAHDASPPVPVARSSYELLNDPVLNKGIAFPEEERDAFALHGLLPPHVGSLEEQVARGMEALRAFGHDLARYDFLRDLQDHNETAFYALVTRHLEETLPLVYTPTVGLGCQRFSHIYRKPRGLFLSLPNQARMAGILADAHFDAVEVIVVTDGERILGLGDLGAGGMGIPVGKLSLYTACGGLHPSTTLPIVLDVGTDRQDLLDDPLYLGWRHHRVRGAQYDEFIEAFVTAVTQRWPHVLLQWEDFARDNATRLLERYRDRLCTFNDDIQGTAAVSLGTLLAAVSVTGVPLAGQRIVIFGAGSAGCGIAGLIAACMAQEGASPEVVQAAIHMVDLPGLLLADMPDLLPFQARFAQPRDAVAAWSLQQPDRIGLLDVVRNLRPTVLIGVSGQPGAFTEDVVRAMAAHAERPVILPLSNPTARCEATPEDLLAWTDGRALIGTGSPFPPVARAGGEVRIAQTNNAYIFPGVGLGAIAARATRVTDAMFMAAARALAASCPACTDRQAPLLPPIAALPEVSAQVALAVAEQAYRDGVSGIADAAEAIRARVWTPGYRRYVRVPFR
jgi:malate dehydrogenase (oxaloacetate-decarboxylating)